MKEENAKTGKSAEAKAPSTKATDAKKPDATPPDIKASETKAADTKASTSKATETKVSEANATDAKKPETKAPAAKESVPKGTETKESEAKAPEANTIETKEPTPYTITVPNNLDEGTFSKLTALISSKQSLLKKSLGTETLEIIKTDKELRFPWFTITGIVGETEAYKQLITAMIKMAKESKRIDPKEKETTNEKFAMRIFTVRLDLKGDEYKLLRKLLSAKLSGNSAWKDGVPPKKAEESNSPSEKADEIELTSKKAEAANSPSEKATIDENKSSTGGSTL